MDFKGIILGTIVFPLMGSSYAQEITLTQISTPFNQPIGIDHHEPTNSIVISVNYPSGGPFNFERVEFDGTHVPFSGVSGFTDEVKIATIRSGGPGGFTTGDLFVGNGIDGQIARLTDGGATVINPWADLPGAGNGLMRGSLYHDRTGVFGGDLIAVTTSGQVWRVAADGTTTTLLASLGVHLEGCITVPSDPAYGPLAGKIIAGAEGQGLLHAIAADGSTASYNVGVNIEDIDMIPPNQNFFGINFGTNRILGAVAADFEPFVGDILLTQEVHSGTGLYRLYWNGVALVAEQLVGSVGSEVPGQWEHVTFSPAGIVEIPSFPVFDPPTPCGETLMASVGVGFSFNVIASDPDPGDVVTLTATGVPAGATFTPSLPTSGNPVNSIFNWTPRNADVGTHVISIVATDSTDLETKCVVELVVAECHLLLGNGAGSSNYTVGGYTFATQLSTVRRSYPVTMTDYPEFAVVGGSAPFGPSGLVTPSGSLYVAQVVMYNPQIFPANPEQSTQGVLVYASALGGLSYHHFGAYDGMSIHPVMRSDPNGRWYLSFPFTID